MFTTGLSVMSLFTPTAPVGFGSAEGMPPQAAQEPMLMMAPALAETRFSVSMAVFPPTRQ